MSSSAKLPFTADEVRDYERRRYRGLDQKLVHSREVRILRRLLRFVKPGSKGGRGSDFSLTRPELSKPEEEKPVCPTSGQKCYASLNWALDAPCGYGRFSALLMNEGYRLVSADISPAMVERACRLKEISINPIGIVCDLTRGLPFRPDIFALVLSMRLFHHLHEQEDREKVLGEFFRVSGGWVILSYYQANALHTLQRRLRRLVKKSRTRIRMLRHREFQEEIERAGFELVRVVPLIRGLHSQHIALLKKR